MVTEAMETRIQEYLEGELSPEQARALMAELAADTEAMALLKEYQRTGASLEKYYAGAAASVASRPRPDMRQTAAAVDAARRARAPRMARWAAGIAAAGVLAVSAKIAYDRAVAPAAGTLGTIVAMEGTAQAMTPKGPQALAANQELVAESGRFKTPAGGRMEVALAGGAGTLELAESTTVEIDRDAIGLTVDLLRGQVIVLSTGREAIRVATPAADADAPGEARFAVARGLRGSEIAVVSGGVDVDQTATRTPLAAGRSFSSTGVSPMPIRQRVAWSAHAAELLAALPAEEEAPVRAAAGVPQPAGTRDVARYAPAETICLLRVDDLAQVLEKEGVKNLYQLFTTDRIQRFGGWLGKAVGGPAADAGTSAMMAATVLRVANSPAVRPLLEAQYGSIAISVTPSGPVILAEVRQGAADVSSVVSDVLQPLLGNDPQMRGLQFAFENGVLVAGAGADQVKESAGAARSARPTAFGESPFLRELDGMAGNGPFATGIDVARAVQRTLQDGPFAKQASKFHEFFGTANMKSVMAASGFSDQTRNQGLRLAFDGPRRGVAGWLGAPGPLSAMQFYSPETHVLVDARVRRPAEMLEDVFGLLEGTRALVPETAEEQLLVSQIAATLGSEASFGIDNPVLPIPNAKIALEVTDPIGFHNGMLALLDMLWKRGGGLEKIAATTETYRDHLIVSFAYPGTSVSLAYAIVDDFVVIGAGAPFLRNAIDLSADGRSIDREYAFQQALPPLSGLSPSLLAYGGIKEADAQSLTQFFGALPGPGKAALGKVLERIKPGAHVMYAVSQGDTIDFYVEGVRNESFGLAGALPFASAIGSGRE